jgi:hypothetical protein
VNFTVWVIRGRKLRKFMLAGPVTDMHAVSEEVIHILVENLITCVIRT